MSLRVRELLALLQHPAIVPDAEVSTCQDVAASLPNWIKGPTLRVSVLRDFYADSDPDEYTKVGVVLVDGTPLRMSDSL